MVLTMRCDGSVISLTHRFWLNVDKTGDCWLWTGDRDTRGYGRLGWRAKQHRAHRISRFIESGQWPILPVLHRCDNRGCVRPSHLVEGTIKQNNHDCLAKGRRRVTGKKPKLNATTQDEIRKAVFAGNSRKELAKHYAVNTSTISRIVTGRENEKWKRDAIARVYTRI